MNYYFSITNTMIGTGMLVIPLQFLQAGLIPSIRIPISLMLKNLSPHYKFFDLVSVIIIGWVNFKTCNVCIIHRLTHEGDLSDVLERVMGSRYTSHFSSNLYTIIGKKWRKVFLWSSVLLLYVANVAYFLLML